MKDIGKLIDDRFGGNEPVETVNKITDGLDIEIPRPIKKDKKSPNNEGKAQNELLQFFMGFLLFGGGLYWVFNSFTVSSSWGSGYWGIGNFRMPMGTMLIPLLIGIGLLFFLDKKAIGGFVCALGVLVILISLVTSIFFHAVGGTLYTYILMFGMVAAGAALLIKVLFKPSSKKSDD